DDVGARVHLTARTDASSDRTGDVADRVTFSIREPFDTGTIYRPERDVRGGPRLMRSFRSQSIGRLQLPQGGIRLQLQALSIPGASVCELDALKLRRVDNSSK